MTTLILLTALAAGWSYDGFVSDPIKEVASPAGRPASPIGPETGAVPAPATPPIPPGKNLSDGLLPPKNPGRRGADERSITMLPPSANPTLWRLADATGQAWEHTDPEWLRRWVESRNASLRSAVPPVAPVYYGMTACPDGRCVRGR